LDEKFQGKSGPRGRNANQLRKRGIIHAEWNPKKLREISRKDKKKGKNEGTKETLQKNFLIGRKSLNTLKRSNEGTPKKRPPPRTYYLKKKGGNHQRCEGTDQRVLF